MKVKLFLICTVVAASLIGCSPEKVFKDKDSGYQMKYDTNWKVSKNVEIEEDYGTYTYSAEFKTTAKTETGEPAATLKVLKEDISLFDITDEDEAIDTVAAELAQRLDDGFMSYQSTTIAGLKGYWIINQPLEETGIKKDIIFALADDCVYEFYYTAVGDENYDLYEKDVNYMLYNFSLTE